MSGSDTSFDVRDHGTALNDKRKKVECKYCGKVVSGFFRLKCHLGHKRGDVTPCEKVPTDVMEIIKKNLFETTIESLGKKVGSLSQPDLPWKRTRCANSNTINHNEHKSIETSGPGSGSYLDMDDSNDVREHIACAKKRVGSQADINNEENSCLLSSQAQKNIARFFYETGIDFSIANTSSFQRMINATLGHGQMHYKIPSFQELRGRILQDEVKETQEYVRKIRNSWASTGCSILLDGWIDEKGRNLVIFLADCPQGSIYLQSSDISSIIDDTDALQLLLDGVIDGVGANNVLQVLTSSTTVWVEDVGKHFMHRWKTIFWTVSASHCIELMLDKIGMVDSVRKIVDKAKIVTKFIYGHVKILTLLKNFTHGCDLIKPSKIRSAMAFMTLENIVAQNQNLTDMFVSSEWNNSPWSCTKEGKRVADLIMDPSFWGGAEMVLKVAVPLVRVLCLINEADKPLVGYIYETMDQVKEAIQKEFNRKVSAYMPFWEIIDDIWDPVLHSPLHAAGYYLNPSIFYSSDFYSDPEVASGLFGCILRLVQDMHTQDLITLQLDAYLHAKGAFEEGSSITKRNSAPPAIWWSYYGRECPELKRFAIRILSQTCDGALKYGLKRSLAEKLLTNGMNSVEQQVLNDLTFVNYNLQLQQYKSSIKSIVADKVDPLDDWIVDEELVHPKTVTLH